jgi:hypothetical protein
MSVGCHGAGTGVACSGYTARWHYGARPKLSDQELARAMVMRLMTWDPAKRREVLRSFDHLVSAAVGPFTREERELPELVEDGEPWSSIFEGSPPSEAQFARLHAGWLEAHPAWK